MELRGEEVKLTRKERRAMGWPRTKQFLIEDIPWYREVDCKSFEIIASRINPEDSLIGTMEVAHLLRLENRARMYAKVLFKVAELNGPPMVEQIESFLRFQTPSLRNSESHSPKPPSGE